jgi:hypothetical protein
MTEADVRRVVSESVSETLMRLGIDTDSPLELQRDLQHLRDWRLSVEAMKRQTMLSAVGIIVAGVLGLIWWAFRGS